MRLLVYKKVYLLKDGYFYILLCDYICVAIIITRDYFLKGDKAGGRPIKKLQSTSTSVGCFYPISHLILDQFT